MKWPVKLKSNLHVGSVNIFPMYDAAIWSRFDEVCIGWLFFVTLEFMQFYTHILQGSFTCNALGNPIIVPVLVNYRQVFNIRRTLIGH